MRGVTWRLKSRLVFYGSVVAAPVTCVLYATSMPGTSYSGPLPAATPALRGLDARLREHVAALASRIGVRNVDRPRHLIAAREYIASKLIPLEAEGSAGYAVRAAEG